MNLPTQGQLLLPLLNVLGANGPMKARDACVAVAEEMGLPAEMREVRGALCQDGQEPLLLDRKIRWTRQNAVLAGLMDSPGRGVWRRTDEGAQTHLFAKPGVVVTVWQADMGAVLWSEFRSAVQYIDHGSVTACFTSPPYPLVRQRSYDQGVNEWTAENWLDTMLGEIERIKPLLARDGSLVLNLGPTFMRESNARNPYMHRLVARMVDNLGWSLIDEHVWVNPTKPRTSPQVTKARTHCANGQEQIFIFSPTGLTKCSNMRVLNPYTPRHKALIDRGGLVVTGQQPSKIKTPGVRFSHDRGGSIPFNIHTLKHDDDREYRSFCKANGLLEHSAMMPMKLAEFFIELTTEPGDLVIDPFSGSLKTMAAALKLDRRCIVTERCLNHIRGGLSRLPPQYQSLATG